MNVPKFALNSKTFKLKQIEQYIFFSKQTFIDMYTDI